MDEIEKNAHYYQTLFALSDIELTLLQEQSALIYDAKDSVCQKFYPWMEQHPFFKEAYHEEVVLAIQDSEDIFWEDLITVDLSDDYIDRQKFFGEMFASSDIPFDAYLAFLNFFHEQVRLLFLEQDNTNVLFFNAYAKWAGIAVATVTDGYHIAANNVLQSQYDALREMSTPITPLWRDILLLPVIGMVDELRASTILREVLERIEKTQAKAIILDISGISSIDPAVAKSLIRIGQASKLMGCVCILCGISPDISEIIVDLDLPIEEMNTASGILMALRRVLHLVRR